ncbi:MAG: hypothetical protein WCV88_06095 [Patescibacteria group bacterium]|jgi:hypothetical protein
MFSHQNITLAAPTTTVVKTGSGSLHAITINKAAASAIIAIYDGITAASGSLIGTITMPGTLLASQATLIYDVSFAEGLTIVTTTAQDITVSYN